MYPQNARESKNDKVVGFPCRRNRCRRRRITEKFHYYGDVLSKLFITFAIEICGMTVSGDAALAESNNV